MTQRIVYLLGKVFFFLFCFMQGHSADLLLWSLSACLVCPYTVPDGAKIKNLVFEHFIVTERCVFRTK